MCVHGVAIPTLDGIRNVLEHVGAQLNGIQAKVLWISLREEPVSTVESVHLYQDSTFSNAVSVKGIN